MEKEVDQDLDRQAKETEEVKALGDGEVKEPQTIPPTIPPTQVETPTQEVPNVDPLTPPPEASAHASPKPEVSGNLAAGLGELLPSELHDAKVEEMIQNRFAKLDEDQLDQALKMAPLHPDYESYVRGIKTEIGVEYEDEWKFGEEEPFLDLVGLHSYAYSLQQFRDRLAMGHPVPDKVSKALPAQALHPALAAANAATPAAAAAAKAPPSEHPSVKMPAPATIAKAQTPAAPATAVAQVETPAAPATAVAKAEPPVPPQVSADATPTAPATAVAKAGPQVPATTPTAPATAVPAPATAVAKAEPQAPATTSPGATPTAPATGEPQVPAMPSPAATAAKASPPQPPAASQLSHQVDQIAEVTLPTSVTHRSEYMAYLRAARNPSKMCQSLVPMFRGEQKLDLFRLWLSKGKDFAKCEIEVKRLNMQRQTAQATNSCLSRAQLEATGKYSSKDLDDLIARKTAKGEYIDDPNFPGREDYRQYVVNTEVAATTARIREDSQQVSSTASITAQEALSLAEDGCDFGNDTHPSIHALSKEVGVTAGALPTPETENKGGGKGGKGRRRKGSGKGQRGDQEGNGNGEPQPDKLQTPLEKATSLKTKVLLIANVFPSVGIKKLCGNLKIQFYKLVPVNY